MGLLAAKKTLSTHTLGLPSRYWAVLVITNVAHMVCVDAQWEATRPSPGLGIVQLEAIGRVGAPGERSACFRLSTRSSNRALAKLPTGDFLLERGRSRGWPPLTGHDPGKNQIALLLVHVGEVGRFLLVLLQGFHPPSVHGLGCVCWWQPSSVLAGGTLAWTSTVQGS